MVTEAQTEPDPSASPNAHLIGGFRGQAVISLVTAGIGTYLTYALEQSLNGFFASVAAMSCMASLCVMFMLSGPHITFAQRIREALVLAVFGFIGMCIITPKIHDMYFHFAAESVASRVVPVMTAFFLLALTVVGSMSGNQLAKRSKSIADVG